jgi:putative transposase
LVPLKCNKKDFEYLSKLNKVSADVWNYCVKIDGEYKKETKKVMTLSMLENSTKQKFFIHAKGINHIIFKYYYARSSMWKSIKAKHKNSRKVNLPYKLKNFLPTGWDYQAIFPDYKKHKIELTSIKSRRKKVTCRVKSMPQNIVEIELVYKGKYYLAIKYKEEDQTNLIQSDNMASIDLGEIHAITSIDNNGNCIIITNRKIRSLIRLKDKRQAELMSKRSNCIINSKMYKKYTKAIWKIKYEFDRKINDAIHKQTSLYLNWCIKNQISKVIYGNVDNTTRNSHGRLNKNTNHKLNMWRFGKIIQQLNNKLTRFGIKLVKVDEYYSSQTCPHCGNKRRVSNRNYECKKCSYKQHRDIVGAINILNNNLKYHIEGYINKVYLQIC